MSVNNRLVAFLTIAGSFVLTACVEKVVVPTAVQVPGTQAANKSEIPEYPQSPYPYPYPYPPYPYPPYPYPPYPYPPYPYPPYPYPAAPSYPSYPVATDVNSPRFIPDPGPFQEPQTPIIVVVPGQAPPTNPGSVPPPQPLPGRPDRNVTVNISGDNDLVDIDTIVDAPLVNNEINVTDNVINTEINNDVVITDSDGIDFDASNGSSDGSVFDEDLNNGSNGTSPEPTAPPDPVGVDLNTYGEPASGSAIYQVEL